MSGNSSRSQAMLAQMMRQEQMAKLLASMAPQFFSDDSHLNPNAPAEEQGGNDARLLSKIPDGTQMAISHFLYRGKVGHNRYYENLMDNILHLNTSVEGWRSDKGMEMLASFASGGRGSKRMKGHNILSQKLLGKPAVEEVEDDE